MTTIAVSIGKYTISTDIKHIDIWADANAVQRFSIQVDNVSGQHNGKFAVNDAVEIDIGGATILEGWIDSVHPVVSSSPDVFTQRLQINGRDYARELVDLTADKYYTYQAGDRIIDDLLFITSSNITMTSSAVATSMSYDSKNEYLLNSFRKICEITGQDFYVDDDAALQLFNAGSGTSGITLQSTVGGGTNNNIISLERDQSEGTDIKNYVIVRGKKVTDGWTEYNSDDWDHPTNSSVTDDSTTVKEGVYSLYFLRATATDSYMDLDFTGGKYDYSSLDWSAMGADELSFFAYLPTDAGGNYVEVTLTDTSGNVITYTFNLTIYGAFFSRDKWLPFTCDVGAGVEVKNIPIGARNVFGNWYLTTGSSFTWLVQKIRIRIPDATSFYVDGLKVPARMISVSQNSGSQTTYGVRHIVIDKPDIESQVELDNYADRYLLLHKDPMTTLTITAVGTAGISGIVNNWKPGYNCAVNIPGEAISTVNYRMMNIHHIYDTDTTLNGFDYYVVLNLTPAADVLDIRRFEAQNRDVALLRELREMLSVLQQEEEGGIDRYPQLPSNLGSHYLISAIQYDQAWEAEVAPVVLATGTDTVTDATASEGTCARRHSVDASGDMLDVHIGVPASNEYVVYFRLKVTSNASASTLATLQVYNEGLSALVTSFNISPNMFGASDTWEVFGIKASMNAANEYSLGIISFVTGITDLYCDWVGITDSPIAAKSIKTINITSGAVTTYEIGGGAVGTVNLGSGSVTTYILAADAVYAVNIAANSIQANHVMACAILANHIYAANILANHLSANSVTTDAIMANSIVANKILANNITANAIAAGSIFSNHLTANAVTTNIIAGQAVSIDKVDANMGTGSVSVLYAKYAEYSRAATGDTTGAKLYTRTIGADAKMAYRIKQIDFLLKGTYAFCDVYINDNGAHNTVITGDSTGWTLSHQGVGTKQRYTVYTPNSLISYRGGGVGTYAQGGADYDIDHVEFYHTLSPVVDMSTYEYVKLAIGDTAMSTTVTIRCDISDGGYYEKTGVDFSTADKTISIALADFSLSGSVGSGWASISEVRLIFPNTFDNDVGLPSIWFTTTTVYTYEVNDPDNYAEYDSTEITVDLAVNTACIIDYWVGAGHGTGPQTAYMEFPASDVRSRNYLEDLAA